MIETTPSLVIGGLEKTVGLVIALVVANWSAFGIAIKCREKIDKSRNLLWGIDGNASLDNKEIARFIWRNDIVLFWLGLVLIFFAVGSILFFAAQYLGANEAPIFITRLYRYTGLAMILAGLAVTVVGIQDARTIWRIAEDRFSDRSD